MTTAREAIAEVIAAIDAFAADLREQGIHVGLGATPRCVVDDEPWPCTAVRYANVGPDR